MLARENLNSLNDLGKIFGKLKTNLNSTTACWISVFSILKLTEIPISMPNSLECADGDRYISSSSATREINHNMQVNSKGYW